MTRRSQSRKKTSKATKSALQEASEEVRELDAMDKAEQRPKKRSRKGTRNQPLEQPQPEADVDTPTEDIDDADIPWPKSPARDLPVRAILTSMEPSPTPQPSPQLNPMPVRSQREDSADTIPNPPPLPRTDPSKLLVKQTKPRVRWNETMEQALLDALEAIAKRGKNSDGFKKEHWVEVAQKVREVYRGPADLDWERAKSKFEDKFRSLWGKWQDHCSGLSGWTENEKGLPQNSEEVMDTYFAAHPEYRQFRFSLPTGHRQLAVILGDRVATGEFVKDFDAESSEEASSDDANDPEDEEDQDVHDLVERSRQSTSRSISHSRSSSTSRPSSVTSSQPSSGASSSAGEKKSRVAQSFRKQLAERAAKRKGEREKKSDKLFRGVAEFESESAKMMKSVMESYEAASRGAIPEAIEWVDKHIATEYSQREVFRIYDLLQDEAKAATLTAMVEERRSGWIEYELEKLGV